MIPGGPWGAVTGAEPVLDRIATGRAGDEARGMGADRVGRFVR